MKKESVVRKADYDRYFIPLPLSKLLGKKKKKYLFSELEKRHPCFSNDFCFDSKLRLGKGGLLSDVVVMNKGKYSSYKNTNGIHFEGLKFKRFKIDWIFMVIPALLLGLGIFFVLTKMDEIEKGNNNALPLVNTVEVEKQIQKEINEVACLAEKAFSCIEKSGGKILLLVWSIRNEREYMNFKISNMKPEVFMEFKGEENFFMSPVSYESGKNSFSVSMERRILSGISESKVMKGGPVLYQNELRDLLTGENCCLLEEKYFPYSISFKFNDFEVFNKISSFLKAKNLAARELSLKEDVSASYLAEIFIEERDVFGLGLNLDLMQKEKEIFFARKAYVTGGGKIKESLEVKMLEDVNLKKLGEVRYADGSRLVFFKDDKGKIIKRKEG